MMRHVGGGARQLSHLKFVDLFAGIGGFHLALTQEFGAECVFASDIDDECRRVYSDNFMQPVHGDIRPLTEGVTVAIPDHDILCAGFPCQPFSKSGFQRGINETRGTLFFNILRILEAKRPRYAILENVRNLAGPRHRDTWTTIIEQLRSLGYRVADEPTIFSPHLLPPMTEPSLGGSPQVRERVFILCERIDSPIATEELRMAPLVANSPVAGWDPMAWDVERLLQPDADIENLSRYRLRTEELRWLEAWNDFLASMPADEKLPGFPIWVDAFVIDPVIPDGTPRWKEDFLRKNSEFYRRHQIKIDQWLSRHNDLSGFPASRRKFEWQAQDAPRDIWQLVIHFRPSGIRVKRGTYLPALVAITQTSVIGWRRRRITPREAARLQGFPDTYRLHSDDAIAYRQLGNAVNVGVVRYVARALINATEANTSGALGLAS
jgi:DNA (cytosine-5)-methyltransferase 1